MKKIVIDCRYLGQSGIGRVTQGILENLAPYRNSFSFCLLGKESEIEKYKHEGDIILDDDSNAFSFNGLFLPKKILSIINTCDLFLSPGYIVPLHVKIKKAVFIDDCIPFDVLEANNNLIDKKIKKFLYKRAINNSEYIFTISFFSLARIKSIFGTKKIIHVIYPGVNNEIVQESFTFSEEKKGDYFLFIGNFKIQKGIDILLKAFRKYKKMGGKKKLVLVGKKEGLRTSISLDNIDADVLFTGRIDDSQLKEYLRKAYCLVQPSRYEGFGLPPMEALYFHVPVIISDIDVFKEIYPEDCVTFYKNEDSDDLMKKMLAEHVFPQVAFSNWNKPTYEQFCDKLFETIK